MSLKKNLITLGIGAGLAMGATSASAQLVDAWKLNLSALNGLALSPSGAVITGATTASNVDHLVINGKSTVLQDTFNGNALGLGFVDNGFLQFLSNSRESGGAVLPLNFGTNSVTGDPLFGYLQFENLTGTLNADASITFTPGAGAMNFWVEDDGDLQRTTGNVLKIATYELIAPSGGSNLNFVGGAGANATIDVTMKYLSGISNLFLDSSGASIQTMVYHLINTDSLLDPNFNPNPSTVPAVGPGVSTIHVQNAGQYNLEQIPVPEPSALGLMGIGLLFAGNLLRKRSKV